MSKNTIAEINTKLVRIKSDKGEYERTLSSIKSKNTASAKKLGEALDGQSATKSDLVAYESKIQGLQTTLKKANEAKAHGESELKITHTQLTQVQGYYNYFINDKVTIPRAIETNNSTMNTLRGFSTQIPQDKSAIVSQIANVDSTISSLHGASGSLAHNKTIYTNAIGNIDKNLVTLNDSYNKIVSFQQGLNREDFYDEYLVSVKHTTYILPHIKGHPRYTEHVEREFNQKAYNETIQLAASRLNEVNVALNEQRQQRQSISQKLTETEQNITLCNHNLGEHGQVKQILTQRLNESAGAATLCQQKMNECIKANQEHASNLAGIENDIGEAKETMDIVMQIKQMKEETLRHLEISALSCQQQIDRLLQKQENATQKLAILEKEVAGGTKATQASLKEEEDVRVKLVDSDREINSLESQLGELGEEGEEDLIAMTGDMSLQDNATGAGIDANHHAEVALAGNNLATDL